MEQRAGAQKSQAEPGRKEKPAAAAKGRAAPELPLQELQHAAGNRAVGRLLRSSLGGREGGGGGGEQPSGARGLRRLGPPAPEGRARSERDEAAREAGAGLVQLKAAPGAPHGGARADDAQAARRALSRGPGQPLDAPTRDFFERSFGYDLSPVRVHHDSQAAESAQALGALAYTYGHQIVFRNGHYAPDTGEGRRLLGHELAHVVQQSGGDGVVQGAGLTRDAYETEADAASARSLAGLAVGPLARVGSALVQKAEPSVEAAPAPAKKSQGVPTPEPGTAYLWGRDKEGDFVYIFNSEDALKSKDIWKLVVLRHLRVTFPDVAPEVLQRAARQATGKAVTGDWRAVAHEYTEVAFTLKVALHQELVSLVRKMVDNPVPAEPPPGSFDVGDEDAGGPGGGGGGGPEEEAGVGAAPPAPPADVEGMKIHIPPELSAEERERYLKLLKELLPAHDPSKGAAAPLDIHLTKRLRDLLDEIDKSPQRADIIALVRAAGAEKADRSLADALETSIADAKLAQARKDFNLAPGSGDAANKPERYRPVRGDIVNLSRELVLNKPAKFMMEFRDEVDAFRVPVARIQWVAHKENDRGSIVAEGYTGYIALPPKSGSIDSRVFEVSFTETGVYTVVALVYHNFYEPNLFDITVRVTTEEELAAEKNAAALKGFAQPGTEAEHTFDGGVINGDQTGTITRGDLDPAAEILSIEARLKVAGNEEEQLRKLIETYTNIGTPEAKRVVSWAEDYLETLGESSGILKEAQKLGATPLGVRGVFASRTPEAPSKELNLLCYFIRQEGDDDYTVILHDFTQLTEPVEYRFSAAAPTVEGALEAVFIHQADAYPQGTLSVTFQTYDEAAKKPANRYVKFDKVTDTVGKKIKAVVFDPYVDIAVNTATAVMMVVPGLQPLAIGVAILYNTARTVSEMEELANKGALSTEKAMLKGLEIGLNLIPLAGKGAKMMTIAGKSYYVVEAITLGGNALLVGTQSMAMIEELRNGVVRELAALEGEINAIEGRNAADPRLPGMKKKREQLIKDGQKKVYATIAGEAFNQGLMMISQNLIAGYMSRRFSVGQLKSQGAFHHEPGAAARYDFERRVIVGDELKITPGELERLQLKVGQDAALEGHVPDWKSREQILAALGDRPVEVRSGARTGVTEEGGRVVIEVGEGATPADIVAAAKGVKPPAPDAAPGAQQQTPPPAHETPPAEAAPAVRKPAEAPAGQAEQTKQAADNVAEAEAAPDKPEPPVAPSQEPATPTPDQPAPDKSEGAPAKEAAAPAPAAEDDFKPVEPSEELLKPPAHDAAEAGAAGDKSAADGEPVVIREGAQSGETPDAKPPEKQPEGAEGEAKAKPDETPAPDSPEAKAKADAEAKKAADAEAQAKADAEAEARAEAATVAARARYAEAKKAGYQKKMKLSEQDTVEDFIARYKAGEELGEHNRWRSANPDRTRKPPIPVTKDMSNADILEHLKGKDSRSTFKKFYETITGTGFATPKEVEDALVDVRRELKIDAKPSDMDKVRHALKEKFKDRMLDSMFDGPDGRKLTPAESHARLRELTTGLDSADKGPMTEEWQQRTRLAAGAPNTAEQVQVKQADQPDVKLEQDRQLDRLEGVPTKTVKDDVETSELLDDVQVNEVKSGEGSLGDHDYGEMRDHLKLARGSATIDVRGVKRTVKQVRWTFTSIDGAKANADFLKDQLKLNKDVFSVEVYNSSGERRVFTGADLEANEWALHDFVGKPYAKPPTPPAPTPLTPTPPTPTP